MVLLPKLCSHLPCVSKIPRSVLLGVASRFCFAACVSVQFCEWSFHCVSFSRLLSGCSRTLNTCHLFSTPCRFTPTHSVSWPSLCLWLCCAYRILACHTPNCPLSPLLLSFSSLKESTQAGVLCLGSLACQPEGPAFVFLVRHATSLFCRWF